MNLIEKLGGYEKAKEALIAEQRSKNIDPVIYINGDEVLIDAIDDALLQYRRQHSIFEVGDYVFHTVCNNPLLEKITWIDGVRIITNLAGRPTLIETFRHATDAEIEAGKKLEVS